MLLLLAEQQHKMLFEIAPDIIPEGYATNVELVLWSYHLKEKADRWQA